MSNKKIIRPCPICLNSNSGIILHTQRFILPSDHILPNIYDLVACSKCGLVYADTSATQKDYDTYYAEMSLYDMDYTCGETLHYQDRAAWIASLIGDKSCSIIDIGCGNGQLLLELKKLGLTNLYGLDPSEKCISDLRAKGISGIAGSIFSNFTAQKYDGAILSGVLEHIYDVQKIMETMKRLLNHNGLLFVCVPDASRYKDYDTVPFDYFNIEHINHFDEISLLNLGLQHGFSTISFLKTSITLSHTTQPILFCAYENKGKPVSCWQSYSRKCVAEYIEQTQKNETVNSLINGLFETQEEIIVWGAGNYTSRLLANSNLGKCNIVMLVDNDKHKQGTVIRGNKIYPPNAIIEKKETSTILIGAAVFCDEIVAEIKRMGLDNKIIVLGKGQK